MANDSKIEYHSYSIYVYNAKLNSRQIEIMILLNGINNHAIEQILNIYLSHVLTMRYTFVNWYFTISEYDLKFTHRIIPHIQLFFMIFYMYNKRKAYAKKILKKIVIYLIHVEASEHNF